MMGVCFMVQSYYFFLNWTRNSANKIVFLILCPPSFELPAAHRASFTLLHSTLRVYIFVKLLKYGRTHDSK